MASELDLSGYKEIVLVLGTAAIAVPALARFRVSPVFTFLAAGAIFGPDGLGRFTWEVPLLANLTVSDRTQITYLAEAGVVFLMFMIGLELTFERLWTMRRLVFGMGALQVVVTGLVLTALLIAADMGNDAALIVGFAFALSSTAIVVQLLADQKRLGSATGRASFSILLFQDLAVVPLLVLVGVLAGSENGNLLASLGTAGLKAVIAIGGILLLGRYLLRPLFRAVARAGGSDLFMAASILVVIGTGLITAINGLSMALGAFIAGLVLAETEFRREVEATIEPFKGLLIGVFFFSVGMSLDIEAVLSEPLTIAGLLIALLGVKFAIAFPVARLFRTSPVPAFQTALLMAGAGEFAFVILTVAAGTLVDAKTLTTGIAVAAISMFLTPVFDWAGRRWTTRPAAPESVPEPAEVQPAEEKPDAIIAGYGRVGELVADMLQDHKVGFLALDTNPDLVARGRKAGRSVHVANATDMRVLRRCGLETAKVLIITMDNRDAVAKVAAAARKMRPDLSIVARARDPEHARQLYAAGVSEAVPEAIEASLHISEAALIGAGVPLGQAIAAIHEQRDQYRTRFQRIESGKRDSVARLRARRTALKKSRET
ncbi:MAG TPA: cation:proton antiporter [Rhizobiaceae bacterium]|nr:cation:proton antiporter [Rhizobiaceae bacterium]